MMCDERVFSPQIDYLSSATDFHLSVAAFDLGDSMDDFAHTVREQLRKHPDTPTVLVGLSMGGIVAMHCLQQFANEIDAVVLMDTNPNAETAERQALRYPQVERALAGELDSILMEDMKPHYLAPANQHDEAILSLVLNMARDLGPDVFAQQSQALMGRHDYRETLSQFDKPALIMGGVYDKLCPVDYHELMHALLPASSLKMIDDAGHLPTLESPDLVNRYLEQFLLTNLQGSTV